MSQRNSQEAKRDARERMQLERERQARRGKARRQAVVGAAAVAALAVMGGVAYAVTSLSGDDDGGTSKDWSKAGKSSLVQPANASGQGGTAVVLGGEGSGRTFDLYEDLRCPACAQFDQTLGEQVKKGAEDGKYELRVHLGAIIDGNLGGTGSKNAASAAGAALDVSKDAFGDYVSQLYSAEHHPQESEDEFADNAYLLEVAKDVDELKGNKDFERDVRKGTFDKWALKMVDSFNDAGIEGTPTVRIDGKDVKPEDVPAQLAQLGVS